MKIGLITCGNIWFSPYIKCYTQILDLHNISYEIVSWNRDGSDPTQGIQFKESLNNNLPRWKKLWKYIKFVKFVKATIRTQNYDKLIIFGPQLAILIASFLSKHYYKKYIFDFRDLSIEQYDFLRPRFRSVLSGSYINVISSPGFLRYLPSGYKFIISHNFDCNLCKSTTSVPYHTNSHNTDISILTIGSIRDFSSNSEVIKAVSNKGSIKISFVGKGDAANALKHYADSIGCKNITFEGYYPKEKEKEFINDCTFLNIFYPKIKSHSSALSNRFYNALIYKRPMIVTTGGIQGDYVEKHNLGLSIDNCDNLSNMIHEWIITNDFNSFSNRCDQLLNQFVAEQTIFNEYVVRFSYGSI